MNAGFLVSCSGCPIIVSVDWQSNTCSFVALDVTSITAFVWIETVGLAAVDSVIDDLFSFSEEVTSI